MAERFGDFELLALLSADAALESYLAQVAGTDTPVVLRRLRPSHVSQPGARDAFLSDAQAAMRLQHTGAARVVAVGEVGHQPYLAQERVDGLSLETIVSRARSAAQWPLPLPRALALFLPALEGLAAAHAQEPALVHREVSPRNVYVTLKGVSVLSGFGVARTRRSAGLGIADAFLSPEQMSGRPLTARSDVFTAALMLFELTCGRVPATGSVGEIAARIGALELDSPESVHPGAAPLSEVLKRALARHEDRFTDAGQFIAALKALNLPLEAPAELGRWLVTLPEQPLPPAPTARPNPGPVPRPRVEALNSAALPVAKPVADRADTSAAPKKKIPPVARLGVGLALGVLGAVLAQTWVGISSGSRQVTAASTVPEEFETEIITVPGSAQVRINEERAGKTPLRIQAQRNHIYTLVFETGETTTDVTVQNTRRIVVDIETGLVVSEDRYGSAPERKLGKKKDEQKKEPAKDKPVETPTPTEQVGDDAQKTQAPAAGDPLEALTGATPHPQLEAVAPASFVLSKTHQVQVDQVPGLPLRADTLVATTPGYRTGAYQQSVMMPGRNMSVAGRSSAEQLRNYNRMTSLGPNNLPPMASVLRHLSLLLTRTGRGVLLQAVTGAMGVPKQPSWAFALSERSNGGTEASPAFQFGRERMGTGRTVVVERDNRFTVQNLNGASWTVSLSAKGRPHPASVVLRAIPDLDGQPVMLDDAALEAATAVLKPGESHHLSGAREAWLAVPTVTGFTPSDIDVTFEGATPPAPGEKADP